jgi:hypothetical protein
MKRILIFALVSVAACSPIKESDIIGDYRYEKSDHSERLEILAGGNFRHYFSGNRREYGTWRLEQNDASECLAIEMPAFTVTNGGSADNGERFFSGCIYKTIFGRILIEVSANDQTYLSQVN